MSAVSAADLDVNNETVVTSEIGEEQLSVSNGVNAIDDLNEDDADSDVVLENAVKSSAAGEKEILAVGNSDSDVLSAVDVKFDFTVYQRGEYTDDQSYPRISGYGKDDDTNEPISVGTISVYVNDKLRNTVYPDEYGEFQAYLGPLAAGTYTIRAVYHDDTGYYKDATYTKTITIDKASSQINIEHDLLELDVGDEIISGAYISPSDAGRLSYSSNDTEVADIINGTNIIVAKKAGSATITVSFGGNQNYTAAESKTIKVIVSEDKTPTSIDIANSTVELKANGEIAAGATLTPADAGNLTYTSSNSGVAVVENGKIKALAAGSANITVSFAGDDTYAAAENKTIAVTVTLNDASVSVLNDTLDLLVGDEFVVVVTTDPEDLNVTFTPDNSGVVSVDENGVATALKGGKSSIIVSVGGDGVYAPNSTTVTVTVSKIPTKINVLNDTLVLRVLDEVATGATLTPADAGNLTYTSNTPSIVEVKDGKLVAVSEGFTLVIVSYEGDDKYKAATSEVIEVSVTKIETSIDVDADSVDMKVGDKVKINATVSPEGAGELDYTSSDVSIVEVNGIGELIAVGDGTANITVRLPGDDKYAPVSKNVTVNVGKIATKFAEVSIVKNNVTLVLSDENGNPISKANISYAINGVSNTTVSDSNGSFVIIGEPGAEIVVNYAGSGIYLPSNITINMLPLRQSTVIVGENFTQYAVDYYAGERGQNFTAQLRDADGNVLANKTVLIGYNGKTLERTTDENGYIYVQINLKDKNRLTFAVTFLGDEDYNATMSVYLITIEQKPVTISASAKTYKATAKTKKYTVTLKTIKGSSADGKTYFKSGKKVTLKLNGKTYTAKTNAKGQATFSLKITKKGKFTAVIKYAGDNTYKSASKNVKITIK